MNKKITETLQNDSNKNKIHGEDNNLSFCIRFRVQLITIQLCKICLSLHSGMRIKLFSNQPTTILVSTTA